MAIMEQSILDPNQQVPKSVNDAIRAQTAQSEQNFQQELAVDMLKNKRVDETINDAVVPVAPTAPVIDEEAIRRQEEEAIAQQIKAIEGVYAGEITKAKQAGEGRVKQRTAISTVRGGAGSDFAAAEKDAVDAYNADIITGINQQMAAEIASAQAKGKGNARQAIADAYDNAAKKKALADTYIQEEKTKFSDAQTKATILSQSGVGYESLDPVTRGLLEKYYGGLDAAKNVYTQLGQTEAEVKEVNGILYEKQTDGTWKAQTPGEETAQSIDYQYVPASKYQEAGYFNKATGEFLPISGVNKSTNSSGVGSAVGYTPFYPSSSTETTPTITAKTFEEYLKQEEDKAGQTFSQTKRDQLKKTYEASQVTPTGNATNADVSKYSYQVQQVIKGNMSAESVLSGGTQSERNKYAKELQDAENRGLLTTTNEEKIYSGLDNKTATAVKSRVTSFKTEPIVTNFNVISEGYNTVKSISDTSENPSDHQALIYAFAKIMDPNSVVRESEILSITKGRLWKKHY